MLAGVGGEQHYREGTHDLTQVQGPLWEVKPLRPAYGVLHCLERFTVQGELVELGVVAMAKTLDLGTNPVLNQRVNPLPGRAPPPFIGVLVPIPQISWREGIPHSDEGGGKVHDKGRVHGLGP